MNKILKATYLEHYKLLLFFNSNEEKRLDMLPMIKKDMVRFQSLQHLLDLEKFKSVQIGEMGELYWAKMVLYPNGEIWDYDISPELCYELSNNALVKTNQ